MFLSGINLIKCMMSHGTKFWGNINLKEFGVLVTGLGGFCCCFGLGFFCFFQVERSLGVES